MKKLVLLAFVCVLSAVSQAQKIDHEGLVQFSGVIVTADSLAPIPFTSVMIKNSNRGTISDYFGFFSFVAKMRDTIEFGAIGFKKAIFVIPDTLSDMRCSMIQILKPDTILLREVVIFPWPTKEQFKEAFIQLRIPDDDLARAEKNLSEGKLAFLASGMAMDGSMNFKYAMEQNSTRLYYAGQLPPNNLLNPIAWSKFIQMWQNGAFKKKETPSKD
ncbi:MAG: carboxypeptidase-like regulatory domain-containing protein [Bacteroidetes bacterium]|mgnify:CR=1 FL=1|nr:carboxypeptidase-like regulatory domain-containing protein [Bacteroidota bacterium]MBP6426930.1 carboxypeptidase-like regulatory domain-containing protein [Bacteroidia bacterium]MBK8363825.1 carboxypeptidase-like regulatory domain-containing protein [Bacteroidota bacterium]MBK9413230.1 carboxypeptidase-like regulatory domain-containing protein [Bacteroidota bacterium]MBL0033737.1 carboxypeptidase-like regulatory domain-containing protein [Bacteroidota bacterium]